MPGFRNSLNKRRERGRGVPLLQHSRTVERHMAPVVMVASHRPVPPGGDGKVTQAGVHTCCKGTLGEYTCQQLPGHKAPVDHSLVNKSGFAFPSVLCRSQEERGEQLPRCALTATVRAQLCPAVGLGEAAPTCRSCTCLRETTLGTESPSPVPPAQTDLPGAASESAAQGLGRTSHTSIISSA